MKYLAIICILFFITPCFAEDFLSPLKKDQKVGLTETSNGYQIIVYKNPVNGLMPYKILEVGNDYIVIEDFTGVKEIRIPIYSIKSIQTIKIK